MSETNRVEAFSDGVLAIVITLLVIEIRAPHVEHPADETLWLALVALAPKIVAWAVAFFFTLVFWVSHHYLFNGVRQVDRGLLWLNGLFLFFMSFVPFPTAFAGDYPMTTPPLVLLSCVMFCAAATFSVMRLYLLRSENLLEETMRGAAKTNFTRSLVGPLAYAGAIVAAFLSPWVCVALLAAVPVYFFSPQRKASAA